MEENDIKKEENLETELNEESKEVSDTIVPYDEQIEAKRKVIFGKYTKSQRMSRISMIVIMVIAVASLILISQSTQWMVVLGWCLIGAGVLGMIIYYFVTKKKFPNETSDYIAEFCQITNERNFNDGHFSQIKCDPKEKMDLVDIVSDGVFANVAGIASRTVVHGYYGERSMTVADISLNKPGKNAGPYFVGKYITTTNPLHFEGNFIINIFGATKYDLPNNLDGKVVLFENEKCQIYGAEGADYEGILGKNFIEAILGLEIKDHLFNINVVVWAGHSAAYLSYDDEVMAIPFDKPFNAAGNEQYRSEMMKVFEALALLKE